MITVDRTKTVETFREILAEYGEDYVYPESHKAMRVDGINVCQYMHDGKPDCIIGVFIDKVGGDLHKVTEGTAALGALSQAGVDFAHGDSNIYRDIQANQDGGCSWGESVRVVLADHGISL